jgi:hypothetical protein
MKSEPASQKMNSDLFGAMNPPRPGEKNGRRSFQINESLKTITGIIVPFEWDTQLEVIAIAISAPGEKEYEIEMDGMGKSLVKYKQLSVTVEGHLSPSHKSAGLIKVQAYSFNE